MNNDHNTVWSIWLFEETGLLVNVKSDSIISDYYKFRTVPHSRRPTWSDSMEMQQHLGFSSGGSGQLYASPWISPKQEQGRRIDLSCWWNSGNLKIFLAVNVVSLICNFASRLVYSFFGFKKAAFAGWCEVNFVEGNYKSSVIGSLVGIAQQAGGVG